MRITGIKHFLLTTILMTCGLQAAAQTENTLEFIPKSLDFGAIREKDGKVTKTVKAVNVSPDSTFIISARTSCGCSEAEYDGRMLAPGDTTHVSITYDPINRPGKFQKTVKIFTGRERSSNMFKISGNVIPSRKHLDKVYPEKAGVLRLSTVIIGVGEMSHAETKPYFIGIYNDSDSPLTLKVESDNPALEATLMPETIDANSVATLTMMLKGRAIGNDVDKFLYHAKISNADTGEHIVSIPVGGVIK